MLSLHVILIYKFNLLSIMYNFKFIKLICI